MTSKPPDIEAVRWLAPDEEALLALRELRGQIASTLYSAADMCALLRCFALPPDDYFGPVRTIGAERVLRTITLAREAVPRLFEDTDTREMIKQANAAVLLVGCLLQMFDVVAKQMVSPDA